METLDWLIVGGGPQGVHLAARLLATEAVRRNGLRIVDPHPKLLHRWDCFSQSAGMRFMRSPAVHHLDLDPYSLFRSVGGKRKSRGKGLFAAPYSRPLLSLFNDHSASVIDKHGLAALHTCAAVSRLHIEDDHVRVVLEGRGERLAKRVVLAIGASGRPLWPAVARSLQAQGGRVHHVFDPQAPLQPAQLSPAGVGGRVGVLGGGITAAQLAIRLAEAGQQVTVLARHAPRVHTFDSDPGWIGPKNMRDFLACSDLAARRKMITAARHRGSMPADVHKSLGRAMRQGTVQWQVDEVTDGAVRADGGLTLTLAAGAVPLQLDGLALATGFSAGRPGGSLVDWLVDTYDLPVAACGFPVVDEQLRWHPRVSVMGALAELELGPTARNITGARRAAERIAPKAVAKRWFRTRQSAS